MNNLHLHAKNQLRMYKSIFKRTKLIEDRVIALKKQALAPLIQRWTIHSVQTHFMDVFLSEEFLLKIPKLAYESFGDLE